MKSPGFTPLPASFFKGPVEKVARSLLGKGIGVQRDDKLSLGEIVEVEAYVGSDDPASHTFRGETPRNRSMFLGGGTCYVYRSYGIHWCMNVVTGDVGLGHAVLLRAARPIAGLESMRIRRGLPLDSPDTLLLKGPGRLAQGLGIDKSFDGIAFNSGPLLLVDLGVCYTAEEIAATPRIGITKAQEKLLRFYVQQHSRWVSRWFPKTR